jgi:hypothetical protein
MIQLFQNGVRKTGKKKKKKVVYHLMLKQKLFDMGMMVAQDYQVTNDKILIGERFLL